MNINKLGSRVYNESLIPEAGVYVLDPVHSFANFTAQHLLVGQVRGSFVDMEGKLIMDEDPLKSSFEFTIKTASITTNHAVRDADLRSERFFNVEKYPEMKYKSTGFTPELGGKWTVAGELTILGNTCPVPYRFTFGGVVKDPWGNTRAALQGKAKVNRKDFGLFTDLAAENGGFMIGKDVLIDFAGEFILNQTNK